MTDGLLPFDGRETLTERIADLFRAHPGEWLDLKPLVEIGGMGGWRTRVSELRHAPYGMTIDNRLLKWEDGRNRSQYRFRPAGSRQEGQAA